MTLRPCLVCGEPSDGPRCALHALPKPTAQDKGYDHHWRTLSERARRLQPFCSDCGTTDEEAWVKLAGGTLADQKASAERARDHIADALDEHIARVDAARAGLAEAIRDRDDAIRTVIAEGASAYRVAQVTGLSQGLIARIRHAR